MLFMAFILMFFAECHGTLKLRLKIIFRKRLERLKI
jgi:hypothetical protein